MDKEHGAAWRGGLSANRLMALLLALLLAACTAWPLAGCSAPADDSGQAADAVAGDVANGLDASEDEPAFDLASFANPFIGTWESDIPSANAKLTFVYKADGTFDYEMEGVPADQGGKGSGAYLINGNIQVSYLDYEGAAAYVFEVVDNDTINVTEIDEVKENGDLVLGSTAPFRRVDGTEVVEKDQPFKLDNPFIGTWNAQIPSDDDPELVFDVTMEYRRDSIGKFSIAPDQVFPDSNYAVYGDVLVTFDPTTNAFEMFTFKQVDADTIDVTELLSVNPDGSRNLGETVPFKRLK
jgi:hypothetical protein